MNLASYIDHTLLKPTATPAQIEKLCQEAMQYKFASVCVNSYNVKLCAKIFGSQGIAVCSVVGFPLGANTISTKAFETETVITDGATEVDMVMNIGAFKAANYKYVHDDIKILKDICGQYILKVIIETAYLNDDEIIKACQISRDAGADFVKTSTGFASAGANFEHVALMKKTVGDTMKIKAAGGIKTKADALTMIEAGANRLGTSSSIIIVEG